MQDTAHLWLFRKALVEGQANTTHYLTTLTAPPPPRATLAHHLQILNTAIISTPQPPQPPPIESPNQAKEPTPHF